MNPLSRKLLAELIATFTLTFVGAGAIISTAAGAGGGIVQIALAHGLALSVAIYATAHVSGAHVNPAVTAAMFATKRISGSEGIAYVIAQCAGSALAALILRTFFPAGAVAAAKLGATLAGPDAQQALGAGGTLVIEAVLTFLLITTIFGVAVDPRGPKNVYGFAIGLTVCLDILCAGAMTGASMNPARSFGPALVGGHWDMHWVYWVGPILGACAGAFVYDAVLLDRSAKST